MENSLAHCLRAEGIAKGRAEGFAKGRAEGITEGETRGRAAILVRQLEHQFGGLTETVQERVWTASLEQLEQWAIGLLGARTLDELFGEVRTV